ncbi:MAG: hypothetical protein A3D10_07635 [Omnitrophica WOR_2 bacterium RIFCSPHIGHO2_02_FULL_48_11]|nr:MAG: hypothetical protein A3D10_07635 [Omnitrophica WOR_2 bacterium RIFCSPHIGHO2_02_FULL_48_11]
MKIYKSNKTVLSLRNNAVAFLNGLTSNAMDKPWNAFVDIHGMIISVFDQLVLNEEEVLAVIDKDRVEAVLTHLDRYMRVSGVKAEKKDWNAYFDCEGNVPLAEGDYSIPQKKGRLIVTARQLHPTLNEKAFRLFRVQNNIPLQGVDFKVGEFLLNVSETDHVSYTKGCFLGQEPISKVHSRSRPTWKLMVKAESDCTDEEKAKMTSKVTEPGTRRIKGFVLAKNVE